jgi:hypothetical protein
MLQLTGAVLLTTTSLEAQAARAPVDLIPGYDDPPDNGNLPPLPPTWTKRAPPWRTGRRRPGRPRPGGRP